MNSKKIKEGNPLFSKKLLLRKPISKAQKNALIKKEASEYFALHSSNRHPVIKKLHTLLHFLKWAGKLLAPDFLIGHPNLFDNLRILYTNKRFKPLRMAVLAWIIFTLTVGVAGIYSIQQAAQIKASADFSIKTGYYFGDGTPLSVTGLGFTPEVVLIKSDTTSGSLVWKSSVMGSAITSYLGLATADNTENEIILEADGFSVSAALEVNTNSTRYTYIAFAGSDCTAGGVMCVGVYQGDLSATQSINTGFQPDLVWVKRSTALAGTFRTSAMSDNNAGFFSATANNTTGSYFTTLDSNGFTVGSLNNTNSGLFYYVAFKNTANKLLVGTFTGNGVDNRNIAGVGFEPDFVFVKQNSANAPVFNTTEYWGDSSNLTTATAVSANHIQSLDADGFQVGNSVNVNASGVASFYFAFGGSPDPVTSGSFFMQRGSYTGNGTSQSIETSFTPNLVFIKGDAPEYAVWSTSLDYNITHYFSLSAVSFAGGITTLDQTNFTVGSHSTVNSLGITYEYIAFGNATTPHVGAHASDFAIGVYSGNGLTPRSIDHIGIKPDMVVTKRPNTTAALTTWTASSMGSNTSAYFSATANLVDGTGFRSLDNDGFTIGSGATVNAAATPYVWFAFREGAYFDVGSYAGNNTVDRSITGTGFTPDFLWTKRDTAISAVHKSSSSTIAALNSQHFMNLVNDTNDIKTFIANGFTVGNSAEVNTSGGTYQYAAWDSTTSSSPPNMPTNSTPANLTTGQDLNVTLVGSAYFDPDSNSQTDAQWQVDNDADFSSPVWTRTAGAAEATIAVTSANGSFANELSGKTELNHNTNYYWRVRYSDAVWSNWSTGTLFTTNVITTPVNSSPTDGGTVTTLTPTFLASTASDPQTGHSPTFAQWQVNTSTSFTSPLYDSGIVAYSNSHALPNATLSDRSTYYWRVRYQDNNGQWSAYSTPTRFLVSESNVNVTPLFGSIVVDQGDAVQIDAQVKLANGAVINNATVTINIYNPSGTKIIDAASMSYVTSSSGIYRYSYSVPSVSGSYLYEVTAVSGGVSGYGAANFEVRTIAADISTTKTTTTDIQTTVNDTETKITDVQTKVDDIQDKSTDIQTKVTDVQTNVDVLIGAMIVTQGVVNDFSASVTAFITSLINTTTDFYKNSVLTFTSGVLKGQSRRISSYDGNSKSISLDPALTSAPANGDTFTINTQNVRVEEQVAEHESAQAAERSAQQSFRSEAISRLASIEGKIDTITSSLNTVNTKLDSVLSTVNSLRSSQQKNYKVSLSDISEIQGGNDYRTTLTILDFESNPVDASTLPSIKIYDPTRVLTQASTPMTRLSTGVYEYVTTISSSATTGLWESIVNIDVGGSSDIVTNDYWQVTGAPAQVIINSMSDLTVPSIAANVTITNEGSAAFEYQYEWCVVTTEANQCGGSDDVYHATGAKLINVGENFNPTLTATVPTIGNYWFKLVVYYGTASSGASRTFTAVAETEEEIIPGGGGGGNGIDILLPSKLPTQDNTYSEIIKARYQLESQSQKLTQILQLLGIMNPDLQSLLAVNNINTQNLVGLQNKVAELRAISSSTRRILEQGRVDPIVETYMKFNSVEIHFLITNPNDSPQTIKFKAFLPEEAKPEHILDKSGLQVDYDANAGVYFVSADIALGPKEVVTRKVEMKDIWIFNPNEVKSLKEQADNLITTLAKTQYEAQGSILRNDIYSTLNTLMIHQEESYSSPQDHIVAYRENKEQMKRVMNNLDKLKELVVQSGASKGVVGQVGGIQTFATWGIILAIVFGFSLLAAIIFAMWRHQTILAAVGMGMSQSQIKAHFGHIPSSTRSSKKKNKVKNKDTIVLSSKKVFMWLLIIGGSGLLALAGYIFIPKILGHTQTPVVSEEGTAKDETKKIASINDQIIPNSDNNVEVRFGNTPDDQAQDLTKQSSKLRISNTPAAGFIVRETASLNSKELSKVFSGDEYEYIQEENGWYQIILKDQTRGWVFKSYIERI